MAQRRMFSLKIVDSDAFMDMPQSSQLLYFHLSMRADDDGFIGNPKRIMRAVGSSEDDIKVLLSKRFLLPFESGILVVKHWKIHNYIQSDRYQPTQYLEEKKRLKIKENGAYTECIQNVSILDTQVRLGKGRLISDSNESVLKNNKKNMIGNKRYKGEEYGYEEPVIDMDSRELDVDEQTRLSEEQKELNKKIRTNLKKIESLRGLPFGVGKDMNFHVKIYRELLEGGWSHQSIIGTFVDLVDTPHWKEKRKQGEYPGMNTVQFTLRNKKPV